MIEVRQTTIFKAWLDGLRDRRAQAAIGRRILRLQSGLLGNVGPIEGPVSELKIDIGPGYRIYFAQRGQILIILLCGGDKNSQQRDIQTAKKMADELKDELAKQ